MEDLGSLFFAIVGLANLVLIEIIRSAVDKIRKKKHGFGGTQDIAIEGTIVTGVALFLSVVFWAAWFITK